MHVIVNRHVKIDGRWLKLGTLLDMRLDEFNDVQESFVHQYTGRPVRHPALEQVSEAQVRLEAAHKYLNVREYLEEKGVESAAGECLGDPDLPRKIEHVKINTLYNPLKPITLVLWAVPARLYHEVVVPGLIDVLKRQLLRYWPVRYEKNADTRALQLTLRCNMRGRLR